MQRDIAAAERAALGVVDSYRVLVWSTTPDRARELARVGAASARRGRPAQLVLSRLLVRADGAAGGGRPAGARPGPDGHHRRRTQRAGRRAAAHGVAARVLTRFSGDPWADLLAQAAGVEANVVLVDRLLRGRPLSTGPRRDPAFTLVRSPAWATGRMVACRDRLGGRGARRRGGRPAGARSRRRAAAARWRGHAARRRPTAGGRRAGSRRAGPLRRPAWTSTSTSSGGAAFRGRPRPGRFRRRLLVRDAGRPTASAAGAAAAACRPAPTAIG